MRSPLSHVSLFTATLVLSLSHPLPLLSTAPVILDTEARTPTSSDLPTVNVSEAKRDNPSGIPSDRAQASPKEIAERRFQEGLQQYRNNQFREALLTFQQVLATQTKLGDIVGKAETLHQIGAVYDRLGEYPQALRFFEQAFAVRQEVGDKAGIGRTLNSIGGVYYQLGEYAQALRFFEQVLAIRRQVGDTLGEGRTLSNIGLVYENLGQYPRALELYQQALEIFQAIDNRTGEAATLNNIGIVHNQLGQYAEALKFYQQALVIRREIGDRGGVGTTLHNIGFVYNQQSQYSQALTFYQQALAVRTEVGDRSGIATTLNNMGLIYDKQGQHSPALVFLKQALVIFRELGDKAGEGNTLDSIGTVYKSLGQYPQALESYQQALAILREVGNRTVERAILSNIGSLLEKRKQPELAIIFYKRSVNISETIRQDIRVLPREQQQSYTQTVADTYRSLANLLLSQERILEAQQVLELLKIQELREFTKDARAGSQTSGNPLNPTEERILKEYGTLIAFGQQVYQCKQSSCNQLSQLNEQLQVLTEQYNQTVQTFEKEIRSHRAQDDAFFDPKKLGKAKEIVEAQPNTVLIYPLVLEDKIWLLWASKGGIVKSVEVTKTGQSQLAETVLKFRQLLQNSTSNLAEVKATGKQLYDWLIKPIEPELKANKIQNLVFSLDRAARYIPMGALFDGQKYLVENYAVSTVLSADLTDMRDRLPPGTQNTSVLALGLSNAVAGFNPLPNVPAELDAIVRKKPNDTKGIYPGLEFLNSAFDFRALRDNLLGHQLLHIATHAEFVPGSPDASYLLLGTGEKLAIPQLATLQDLGKVQLVVLSACQTALAQRGQDGKEINGISYYFLNGGAKAVMASLWSVNDDSTRLLMQNFYGNLAKGTSTTPITKAQALQQAQLSLLHGESSTTKNPDQRASLAPEARPGSQTASTNSTTSGFAHPYYWAPFILIGNSL